MGRESRHYRKRSSSRGRSGSRSKSRSPSDKRVKRAEERRSRSRERDRRRERSRSREKRRSRSRDRKRLNRRSRSRERERSRERRRSRSRERRRSTSRNRGRRSRSASPGKNKKNERRSKSKEKTDGVDPSKEKKKDDKDEEKDKEKEKEKDESNFDQNKLEEEMRKRKERVEKWREDQRKRAIDNIGELKKEIEEMKQGKKWSLEDDDDDEEEPAEGEKEAVEAEDEELDPLDAYMEEVKEEVKKCNMGSMKGGSEKKSGPNVTKVVTVVTTKKAIADAEKKKGELMENDQDAMEYSSEEEEVDLQTALTGYQTKQRKLLEPVDHGKIEYEPYRKNFYVEVPELAKMNQEEVNAYRLELEGITVKGKGCPKPIKHWVQCGISMKILASLKKQAYEKPTPIQAQAIPAVMSGRDLIGIAKTGSGKTIAFLLPMFRHIMDQRPLEEGEGPIATDTALGMVHDENSGNPLEELVTYLSATLVLVDSIGFP